MKALGIHHYGGPDVIEPIDLPDPHPGTGQVRVKVRAAAINPADVMLRDGSLASYYPSIEPPFVPGMDFSGTIDEIGSEVHGFAVGDSVVGIIDNHASSGAYSEFVVVPAQSVVRCPAVLGSAEAASFLMNALTAHTALTAMNLLRGARVLVTGAAGGVGGYAVQLAALGGLRVAAVASADDHDLVAGFGADVIVPRGDDLAERVLTLFPGGVDAVVDAADLLQTITPAITDTGQIAVLRFWPGDPGRDITVHHINVRDHVTDQVALRDLVDLIAGGHLSTRVAATYSADDAVAAHTHFDRGGLRGRIVIEFPAHTDS